MRSEVAEPGVDSYEPVAQGVYATQARSLVGEQVPLRYEPAEQLEIQLTHTGVVVAVQAPSRRWPEGQLFVHDEQRLALSSDLNVPDRQSTQT